MNLNAEDAEFAEWEYRGIHFFRHSTDRLRSLWGSRQGAASHLNVWPHPFYTRHPRENFLRIQERFAGCPDWRRKYGQRHSKRIGFGPKLTFANTHMRTLICLVVLALLGGCAPAPEGVYLAVPVASKNGKSMTFPMRLEFRNGQVAITQLPTPEIPQSNSERFSYKRSGRKIQITVPRSSPSMLIYDPIEEMTVQRDGSVIVGSVRFVRSP